MMNKENYKFQITNYKLQTKEVPYGQILNAFDE
jgi:hypothetical protein